MMKEVYVLWWRYSDGSAAGVWRAYSDKQRAEEDMKLLEQALTSKEYELETLPLYGAEPSA